jgi:hypothetical protein
MPFVPVTMSRNPLLETHLSIVEWRRRLLSVSARLYEADVEAWSCFEPARRKLDSHLSFLDYESYIDAERDTPQAAMKEHPEVFEQYQWADVASTAASALGHSGLIQIIEGGGETRRELGLSAPRRRRRDR